MEKEKVWEVSCKGLLSGEGKGLGSVMRGSIEWRRKTSGKCHVRVRLVDKKNGWEVSREGLLSVEGKWLGSVM